MSVWDALDLVRDLVTDLLALSAFLLALYASKKVDERGEGGREDGDETSGDLHDVVDRYRDAR